MISNATEFFSADYATAREKFLACCRQAGCEVEPIPHPEQGPNGELLALDVAWCGDPNAKQVLILSSGLHGLEGPLGSACQLAAMQKGGLDDLAKESGWRVLLLHALNPFGFAHHRRWDSENIDPNRNFWLESDGIRQAHSPDAGEPHGGAAPNASSVYSRLDPWLNPAGPIAWHDAWTFYAKALGVIVCYGYSKVKQAIAEGQFDFPRGLFFGGTHPCWTRKMLEQHLPTWVKAYDSVAHIDVHSGLGRWGNCKLLLDYPLRPELRDKMKSHPADTWEEATPTGTAYNAVGGLSRWCDHHFADQNYLYLCAEVGTYGPIRVLRALRAENQQWFHQRTSSVIDDVREMFCPASSNWRHAAVNSVWRVIQRTMQ